MSKIILYHGSDHIIKSPSFELGKETNDYGKGFYLTEEIEVAKEWACKKNTNGFVNKYELDLDDLKVLNLLDDGYNVLNWIALLLEHRTFTIQDPISLDAKYYIINNFGIITKDYDVIIGYRADDSYFSYTQSFINNTLPLRLLSKALTLGKLGTQIALVSKKAFDSLKFIDSIPVDKNIYYSKYIKRDTKARNDFMNKIKNSKINNNDIYVMDIIRKKMKNDDKRLQ